MTGKYKRGRIVRSIADFSTCKAEMFWIEQGHIVRHRAWLTSWQYHYLERMIKGGHIFVAENEKMENEKLKRVDFLMGTIGGNGVTGIRAYIDYKRVKDLTYIENIEGFEYTCKEGSFYKLWTLYVNECDIEVENSTLKISRKQKDVISLDT